MIGNSKKLVFQLHFSIGEESHAKFLEYIREINSCNTNGIHLKVLKHKTLSMLNPDRILREEVTTSTNMYFGSEFTKRYTSKGIKDLALKNGIKIGKFFDENSIKWKQYKIEEPYLQDFSRGQEILFSEFHFKLRLRDGFKKISRKDVEILREVAVFKTSKVSLVEATDWENTVNKPLSSEKSYVFTIIGTKEVSNFFFKVIAIQLESVKIIGETNENVIACVGNNYDDTYFSEAINESEIITQLLMSIKNTDSYIQNMFGKYFYQLSILNIQYIIRFEILTDNTVEIEIDKSDIKSYFRTKIDRKTERVINYDDKR